MNRTPASPASSGESGVDSSVRQRWRKGSKVQIYSNSRKNWFVGDIVRIFHDAEGEWLEVRYDDSMSKQVQRYSTEIKPRSSDLKSEERRLVYASGTAGKDASPEAQKRLRLAWHKKSEVEIYSNALERWFRARVEDVFSDEEGEWLTVVWESQEDRRLMSKQVQRASDEVRPAWYLPSPSPSATAGAAGEEESKGKEIGNQGAEETSVTPRIDLDHFLPRRIRIATSVAMRREEVKQWDSHQVSRFIRGLGSAYEAHASNLSREDGASLLLMAERGMFGLPRVQRLVLWLEVQKTLDSALRRAIFEKEVLRWGPDQVGEWAKNQGVSTATVQRLDAHGVGAVVLFECSPEDLVAIGARRLEAEALVHAARRLARELRHEEGSSTSSEEGGQGKLAEGDEEVLDLLLDMAGFLSQYASLFNVPSIKDHVDRIEGKAREVVSRYRGECKLPSPREALKKQVHNAEKKRAVNVESKESESADLKDGKGRRDSLQNDT